MPSPIDIWVVALGEADWSPRTLLNFENSLCAMLWLAMLTGRLISETRPSGTKSFDYITYLGFAICLEGRGFKGRKFFLIPNLYVLLPWNSTIFLTLLLCRSWNAISFYYTTNHLRFTVLGINQFKSPKAKKKKLQQFPLNYLHFGRL